MNATLLIETFESWLILNKDWLEGLVAVITFISGLFGILYENKIKRDFDKKTWIISTPGKLIIIAFVASSIAQGFLTYATNEKQKIDKAKDDSTLYQRFKTEIDNLHGINKDLNTFKEASKTQNDQNVAALNKSLSKADSIKGGLNTLYATQDTSFKSILSYNNQNVGRVKAVIDTIDTVSHNLFRFQRSSEISQFPVWPLTIKYTVALNLNRREFFPFVMYVQNKYPATNVQFLKPEQFIGALNEAREADSISFSNYLIFRGC